jgi:HAE1 family hydrophobic/amphiphilic exporter-1
MGMTVFSGMLVATILGVLLIPMLFVAVQKVMGGTQPASSPAATTPPALATDHGHAGH